MKELFKAMLAQAQEDLALGLGNKEDLNIEIQNLELTINKLN